MWGSPEFVHECLLHYAAYTSLLHVSELAAACNHSLEHPEATFEECMAAGESG